MTQISESISKKIKVFERDLQGTKGQKLDIKNPEYKRIIGNTVANEKAYQARFGVK